MERAVRWWGAGGWRRLVVVGLLRDGGLPRESDTCRALREAATGAARAERAAAEQEYAQRCLVGP